MGPEGFYEMELRGKSKPEILRIIRGLKNQIGHLKKCIESSDSEIVTAPDERTQLWCTRLYLERAIQAYEKTGEKYQPSKVEQIAADFDAAIPNISKIVFFIGGFFSGYETRTLRLDEERLYLWVEHSLIPTPSNLEIEPDYPMTKGEFLDGLRELHIGEWHHNYSDPNILDGTQWELFIEYSDDRKKKMYCGSNAFPFSFMEFCELIGIQDSESSK